MGKDALIQKIDKLDDTTSRILEDQAMFDNDLKTIYYIERTTRPRWRACWYSSNGWRTT